MGEYRLEYKKVVWGWVSVIADSIEEATTKIDEGDWDDDLENKEDREFALNDEGKYDINKEV